MLSYQVMKRDEAISSGYLGCPAYIAIQILQEKWVLHIIHSLLEGPRGFNELSRNVGGCNPTTLAQRLGRLESLGLVTKDIRSVVPPKSSYALTPSGEALQAVVDAIDSWACNHLGDQLLELPRGQSRSF